MILTVKRLKGLIKESIKAILKEQLQSEQAKNILVGSLNDYINGIVTLSSKNNEKEFATKVDVKKSYREIRANLFNKFGELEQFMNDYKDQMINPATRFQNAEEDFDNKLDPLTVEKNRNELVQQFGQPLDNLLKLAKDFLRAANAVEIRKQAAAAPQAAPTQPQQAIAEAMRRRGWKR